MSRNVNSGRSANKRAVIDVSDDESNEPPVKKEVEPVPAQEILDLQQKVTKLEKDKQSLIRIAGEAQARVEFLENLIDKKPAAAVDGKEQNQVDELQKKVNELTHDRDELVNKLSEADGREKKLVEEQQKKIDELTTKLSETDEREKRLVKEQQKRIDELTIDRKKLERKAMDTDEREKEEVVEVQKKRKADTDIVIRWEIDKAAVATGNAMSGVFHEGGFKWVAGLIRQNEKTGELFLLCAVEHNNAWKCEVEVENELIAHNSYKEPIALGANLAKMNHLCFSDKKGPLHQRCVHWPNLTDPCFMHDNKITIEFRGKIVNSGIGELLADRTMFDAPNETSNVVLKIGGKKLHVSKEILSEHSLDFRAFFFGNIANVGIQQENAELDMDNVVYYQFLDLLLYIYKATKEITDRTVLPFLNFARQINMEGVRDESVKHLIQSTGFDTLKKLQIADRDNLIALRDQSLQSIANVADLITSVKEPPEYKNFSDDMKTAIDDRMSVLKKEIDDEKTKKRARKAKKK